MTIEKKITSIALSVYIFVGLALLCLAGFVGYKIYSYWTEQIRRSVTLELAGKRDTKPIPLKQISDGTVSSAVVVTQQGELQAKIAELAASNSRIEELTKELQQANRQISSLTQVKAKVIEKVVYKEVPSSKVEPSTDKDSKGEFYKRYSLDLISNKISLGTVSFHTGKLDSPWDISLTPINLELVIIQSVLPNAPDRIGVHAYIQDSSGNKQEIKIESMNTQYVYPAVPLKWSFGIQPFTLDVGIAGLIPMSVASPAQQTSDSLSPSLSLSLSTHIFRLQYGSENIAKILGVGVGYSFGGSVYAVVYPISLNVRRALPFLHNTYFTVGVGGGYHFHSQQPHWVITIGVNTSL